MIKEWFLTIVEPVRVLSTLQNAAKKIQHHAANIAICARSALDVRMRKILDANSANFVIYVVVPSRSAGVNNNQGNEVWL